MGVGMADLELFRDAVKSVRSVVERVSPNPMATCCELAAKGGVLTVRGTDFDRHMAVRVPCGGEFVATVNMELLAELQEAAA